MIHIIPICQVFNIKYISYLNVIYNEFQLPYNLLFLSLQLCTTISNVKSDSYSLAGGRTVDSRGHEYT